MASILSMTSGSRFMGNPITYKVKSELEPTNKEIAFHRVKLICTPADEPSREFVLSEPVSQGGEELEFDVSSVLRSISEAYQYAPVTTDTAFPSFGIKIKAQDVWMEDGILKEPAPNNEKVVTTTLTDILMGAYSDYERLKFAESHSASLPVSFSTKPDGGELVCPGDKVVYGVGVASDENALLQRPYSKVRKITAEELNTVVSLPNGKSLFVTNPSRLSRLFQFVNSRGVVESIRTWASSKVAAKGGNEEITISRFETFKSFSRSFTNKKKVRTEFSVSSGPVTREWAEWFIYEFGQSEQYWLLTEDNIWLPCSVTIDDNATVFDNTKSDLCSVEFIVKPDLYGMVRL